MSRINWIYRYYQGIKDGTYCVNEYVRLVYEYIVHGIESGMFFYSQKKASAAIDWIEKHCFHTEGDLAPGKFKLTVWQKAFISCIFGIVDKKKRRQFREIFLVVGRKNGKTKLAASIAKYIWEQEGGYGARVLCVAPKLEQADLVYNDIWQMVLLDPEYNELKEKLQVKDQHNKKIHNDSMLPRHRQTDLAILGINSTVKKLAYAAKRSDGFNPSLAIMDEISSFEGDKGLKQYEVIKSGMGARSEGLMLSCTTSGYVNDSIYDELIKRSTRFLYGDSKEKRLLPFLYMIDDIDKWNDIDELQKSNPNLGVSVSIDYMIEEIAVAEESLSKRSEFITKYCNLKQNSSLAWLPASVIEKSFDDNLKIEDFKNNYAVCGVDLSRTTDLTAAVCVVEKDGELYVFSRFWLPAERIEDAEKLDGIPYGLYIKKGHLHTSGDNFIDYHDVFNWFTDLITEYQIYPLMTGYDRYSASYLVSDMKNYGFRLDDVYQGDNLHPVILETEGLLKDNKIHFNNDLMKMHLYNSAIKMNQERARGKLVKLTPTAHVDGVAALLDAMTVRQKWYGELGEQLKNED